MTHSPTRTSDFALTISNRATVPTVTAWAVAFGHMVLVWNERSKSRKQLKYLTRTRLDDLGLTAKQVRNEANKRFYQQ